VYESLCALIPLRFNLIIAYPLFCLDGFTSQQPFESILISPLILLRMFRVFSAVSSIGFIVFSFMYYKNMLNRPIHQIFLYYFCVMGRNKLPENLRKKKRQLYILPDERSDKELASYFNSILLRDRLESEDRS